MIRTNLATRPDEGRRSPSNGGRLALAAAVVIATLVNGVSLVHYLRSDTQLKAQASQDEARAADAREATARLTRAVAEGDAGAIVADAEQARRLIARRGFSWTELLNRFETTLPGGVRLTSVRPGVGTGGGVVLEVSVIARAVDDLDQFLSNLENTGAFAGVLSRDERRNEVGRIEALIQATYTPAPRAGHGDAAP
jgi:Tfp pilus assembly protein PilN